MINKEAIRSIISNTSEDYSMGFITSYDIIKFILDEIPEEDNDVVLRLLEKRDELLKPLNDFYCDIYKGITEGRELSEIV